MIPTLSFGLATMSGFAANSVMAGISGLAGAGMSAAASEVAQGNMSHGVVRANMINMNKYDAALKTNIGWGTDASYDSRFSNMASTQAGFSNLKQANNKTEEIDSDVTLEEYRNDKIHSEVKKSEIGESEYKFKNKIDEQKNITTQENSVNLVENKGKIDIDQAKAAEIAKAKNADEFQQAIGGLREKAQKLGINDADFKKQVAEHIAKWDVEQKGYSFTNSAQFQEATQISDAVSKARNIQTSKENTDMSSHSTANSSRHQFTAAAEVYAQAGVIVGAKTSAGISFTGTYTDDEQRQLATAYKNGDVEAFNKVLDKASSRMASKAQQEAYNTAVNETYVQAHSYLANNIHNMDTNRGSFITYDGHLTGIGGPNKPVIQEVTPTPEEEQQLAGPSKNKKEIQDTETDPKYGGKIGGAVGGAVEGAIGEFKNNASLLKNAPNKEGYTKMIRNGNVVYIKNGRE